MSLKCKHQFVKPSTDIIRALVSRDHDRPDTFFTPERGFRVFIHNKNSHYTF